MVFVLTLLVFSMLITILHALRFKVSFEPFELLPSLFWIFLACIPFISFYAYYDQDARNLQTIGLFITSIFIFSTDLYVIRKRNKTIITVFDLNSHFNFRFMLFILALAVLVIPLFHYSVVDTFPFFEKILGLNVDISTSVKRERFSKTLDIPYIFKYSFNWVYTILGPLLIVILFRTKKFLVLSILLIWITVYALSSNAKFPVISFIIAIIFCLLFISPFKLKKALISLLVVVMISFSTYGAIRGHNLMKVISYVNCGEKYTQVVSPADSDRICFDHTSVSPLSGKINYLVYRAFLTPTEVSNYWYKYVSENSVQRDLVNYMIDGRGQKTANDIGIYAYQKRFPDFYGLTVSAYGSMDADAFSFFGFYSIILVGLLFSIVRLILFRLCSRNSLVLSSTYPIGIALLCLAPPQASIQAILLAQGLLILIVLAFIVNIINKKK